jgi:hypothetical protein
MCAWDWCSQGKIARILQKQNVRNVIKFNKNDNKFCICLMHIGCTGHTERDGKNATTHPMCIRLTLHTKKENDVGCFSSLRWCLIIHETVVWSVSMKKGTRMCAQQLSHFYPNERYTVPFHEHLVLCLARAYKKKKGPTHNISDSPSFLEKRIWKSYAFHSEINFS